MGPEKIRRAVRCEIQKLSPVAQARKRIPVQIGETVRKGAGAENFRFFLRFACQNGDGLFPIGEERGKHAVRQFLPADEFLSSIRRAKADIATRPGCGNPSAPSMI